MSEITNGVTDTDWIEAYEEHIDHVHGANYCEAPLCPFFVEPWDRSATLELQDSIAYHHDVRLSEGAW